VPIQRPHFAGNRFGLVSIRLVFETHSWSEDNEREVASGWNHGRLSPRGRGEARQLGERRRADHVAAVFTSDLSRSVETAEIAFEGSGIPVLHDWRLRECDYGRLNGSPAIEVHGDRRRHLEEPYPGGESWRQAIGRVGRFLPDVALRWEGARVLIIGHVATRWALDYYLGGIPLEQQIDADFAWQEGWEYLLP
jgi:alpha-ribazole phosphatase/probable phosphoglycerate mutase